MNSHSDCQIQTTGIKSKFFVVIMLLFFQFLAYGLSISKYGIYSDDWVFFEPTILGNTTNFQKDVHSWFMIGFDVRPLRFIEHGIISLMIHSFGLPSAYSLLLVIEAISAWMIFLIFSNMLPPVSAFAIALFFLLAPLDTTLLWLATLHWRIAFFLVLSAMYLIKTRVWVLSILLLLLSSGFNEGPMPLIAISGLIPWPSISRRSRWLRTGISTFICLSGYLTWRLLCFLYFTSDPRINMLSHQKLNTIISRFLLNYIVALYVIFISSVKFCFQALRSHPGIFAGYLTGFLVIVLILYRIRSLREGMYRSIDLITLDLRIFFLIGLFVWIGGYWTGIFMWTSFVPCGSTRMNYPGNLVFTLCIFVILILVYRLIKRWNGKSKALISCLVLAAGITAILLTRCYRVQRDYVSVWNEQVSLITEFYRLSSEVPEGTLIILKYEDPAGRSIATLNETWQHEVITRLVFPPGVRLVLEKNIRSYSISENNEITIYNIFEKINIHPGKIVYWLWNDELHQIQTIKS